MSVGTGSWVPLAKIGTLACSCIVVPSAGRPSASARAADLAAFAGHGASVVSTPGNDVDAGVSLRLAKKKAPMPTTPATPAIQAICRARRARAMRRRTYSRCCRARSFFSARVRWVPVCAFGAAGLVGVGASGGGAWFVPDWTSERGRTAVPVAPACGRFLVRLGLRRFLVIWLDRVDQNAAPASGASPLYERWPNGGAAYDDVKPNAAARFGRAHVCTWCQATSAICAPFGSVPAAPWSG